MRLALRACRDHRVELAVRSDHVREDGDEGQNADHQQRNDGQSEQQADQAPHSLIIRRRDGTCIQGNGDRYASYPESLTRGST